MTSEIAIKQACMARLRHGLPFCDEVLVCVSECLVMRPIMEIIGVAISLTSMRSIPCAVLEVRCRFHDGDVVLALRVLVLTWPGI